MAPNANDAGAAVDPAAGVGVEDEAKGDGAAEPEPKADVPPNALLFAPFAAPPKPPTLDPEAVSSAWLASLGQTLAAYLTADVLPRITKLTPAGAAQLVSDLEYLSNILRALNAASDELERWKQYVAMDSAQGQKKLGEDTQDDVLQAVAKMRGWSLR